MPTIHAVMKPDMYRQCQERKRNSKGVWYCEIALKSNPDMWHQQRLRVFKTILKTRGRPGHDTLYGKAPFRRVTKHLTSQRDNHCSQGGIRPSGSCSRGGGAFGLSFPAVQSHLTDAVPWCAAFYSL